MLSRDTLDRLKLWQLQLKGTVAAQEHRLKSLERRIVTIGTVPQLAARSLASLEKAIVVCKNTLIQLEQASRHLATLFDFYDRQVNDSPPPRSSNHISLARCQLGAKTA